MTKWKDITHDDVIKAIEIFNAENPDYPAPRNTFLLYEGRKYPAKHIRGMAYKVHYNQEISKAEFTGGNETYKFFKRLGFDVQYNPTSLNKSKPVQNKPKTPKITILSENKDDKITVPTKRVIEQKNALQLILNRIFDGDIVCEKTFDWMKTPDVMDATYQRIYNALVNYRGNDKFAKKNVSLRCDFVCQGKKLIVEYDERQHFTEARRLSLLSYPDVPLQYDDNLWIKACEDIGARDNSPADRDEIRAYYDSTRDIEAYRNGYSLVRIMHGQIDFEKEGARDKLERILKNWALPSDE